MPFTNLLMQLVSSVDGATGALILEADGEAVQWYSPTGAERLRLRCAYLVNVLQSFRTAAARLNLGETGHLAISYDGASFVVQEVSPGYYLLIEMSPQANIALAVHRLQEALPEARALFEQ
ncbi:MAG: roadblock/LC7 domain-containing protein [Acidobacteriota bacterium]